MRSVSGGVQRITRQTCVDVRGRTHHAGRHGRCAGDQRTGLGRHRISRCRADHGRIVVRDPGNARLQVFGADGEAVATWAVISWQCRSREPLYATGDTLLTLQPSGVVADINNVVQALALARMAGCWTRSRSPRRAYRASHQYFDVFETNGDFLGSVRVPDVMPLQPAPTFSRRTYGR